MDPLGHLSPWLFKDLMEKENSEYFMFGAQESILTRSS
jgi:hypothetical protein